MRDSFDRPARARALASAKEVHAGLKENQTRGGMMAGRKAQVNHQQRVLKSFKKKMLALKKKRC
jgi:hypothetical protein